MPRVHTHVHKYQRKNIGKKVEKGMRKKYFVFACALPHCNHYLIEELVVGKLSKCWRCEEEFVIYRDSNNHVPNKPHCITCTRSPGEKKEEKKQPESLNLADMLRV